MGRDRGVIALKLDALRSYKDSCIAIYGLSPLTETLLKQLDGYQVAGLLDGYRTTGELYGQRIFSLQDAARAGVRLILVAARPESCKVIAKRIEAFCREQDIALLDVHGNDLRAAKRASYAFPDGLGVTKETLRREIDAHDVVSADLFDTLLMRRTLFPTDVFEIVDRRLREKGFAIEAFPQKRLEAERELNKNTVPTLLEIYSRLLERCPITGLSPEELTRLEWETDRALLVPRKELCALLEEVCRSGKELYIVSDTFYTEDQLAVLLEDGGVTWYTDILASCEHRTDKGHGLFQVLRQRIPGKTCLHIGDSEEADVKGPERSGYTGLQLYSGLELFEKTGCLGLWDQIQSLSSRIQAGMLVAGLLNSPFQFEEPERKLHVTEARAIGYLFFGPVMTSFVIWLYRQMRREGLRNLWFCARDGYLIQKLYDQLDYSICSVYFLTSRFAAIRAGMEDEEDVRYVEEMRFSGSLREQLRERFGISIEEADGERGRLLDYKEEILKAAEESRAHYRTYLRSLELAEGPIAFFDFVARGTVQMYIRRLTDRPLKGFYFSQLDRAYMREKQLDILPFYEQEDSGIFRNFYLLEAVVTSPQPSVLTFDEHGEAVFGPETRTRENLECIRQIQEGILEYFQTFLALNPEWEQSEEKELGSSILSLLHEIEIWNKDFLALKVDDPFFHRVSDVSDLL